MNLASKMTIAYKKYPARIPLPDPDPKDPAEMQ